MQWSWQHEVKLLLVCICLDTIGSASILLPGVGDEIDIVWAPVFAWILAKLFPDPRLRSMSYLAFVEEILPAPIDLLPTASLAWLAKQILSAQTYMQLHLNRDNAD